MPGADGLVQVTSSQLEHNPPARFVYHRSTDSFFSHCKPIATDSLWKWFAPTVPCAKLQRNVGNVSLGNVLHWGAGFRTHSVAHLSLGKAYK